MFYAIKSIDGKELNRIEVEWDKCKPLVIGHKSVYKAFLTKDEAEEYLSRTELEASLLNSKTYTDSTEKAKKLKVRFLFDRFRSEENGFCISIYQTKKGERITCKGYNLPHNKNLYYTFGGHYNLDKKNGYEYIVESYKEVIEDTKEGVIAYLSSGVIKGVGEKKATAIYNYFGSETMKVLEEEPERLKYVPGFSSKSAKAAINQLNEAKGAKEITQFLLKYGISQKYAMAIYAEKKSNSLSYIKEHPYALCSFPGVSFETADIIAADIGIAPDNEERMQICMFTVLKEGELNGNTGLEWMDFCKAVSKKLGKNVSEGSIVDLIKKMVEKKLLCVTTVRHKEIPQKMVFSGKIKGLEESSAKNVLKILNDEFALDFSNSIEKDIAYCEAKYKVKLDDVQKEAIRQALTGVPLFTLTGGPGTGKTMLVKIIAEIYSMRSENIIFLAPTGRAARRMMETSGRASHTIHSYLKIGNEEVFANPDDDVLIKNSLVVIDEFSMVDTYAAAALFSSLVGGNRVVIVGDPNQLPSVGCGAVLRDILECPSIKRVHLSSIYRQVLNEKIVDNCAKVNSGDGNIEVGSDFNITEVSNMEDVRHLMIEKYVEAVKTYGVENVMCLCPYREHTAGTKEMNKSIQDIINPLPENGVQLKNKDEFFRVGDMVMHLKNDEDVSNGDIGRIVSLDTECNELVVAINKHHIVYEKERIKDLTLAYATTVHKSQGSEADAIICCFTNYHKAMLYRNMPYVAFSRAKKIVEFIGELSAIKTAAETEIKNERITLFGKYLNYYTGEFV